ncbi:MAG TPA: hypothetical protein VE604_06865 [Candidatus Polarisedimenticolia bacterium]|nr:hypothetical protein [Candidatus Polarisedimenticolia bacterium]
MHGATGYLFDQFLNSVVNERHDEYGNQSKENRRGSCSKHSTPLPEYLAPKRVGVGSRHMARSTA